MSYKEIQSLAGYTSLIHELNKVLTDLEIGIFVLFQEEINSLKKGVYVRRQVEKGNAAPIKKKTSFIEMNQGQIIEDDNDIKFENVPIYTPNGDLISSPISFEVINFILF